MPDVTVTSKGRITLPLEVRESLGLRTGSRVSFVRTEDGRYELIPGTGTVQDLRGVLSSAGAAALVTLEQMEDAVAAGAGERAGT